MERSGHAVNLRGNCKEQIFFLEPNFADNARILKKSKVTKLLY